MNKKLLFLITGLMFFLSSYSQCAYTGTPLTSVGTYTFCINTPGTTNTITTATTRSGQYALVNVVQGFTYRFAVGNIFSGVNENLTIINAADNSNFGAGGFVSNSNGATITSWTSPISGQIKVLLSSGSCINDNTAGGVLTLTLMAVGNTLDSQTTFGTDNWVGHVYDWTGTAPPGGSSSPMSPATTTPFTAANYVGYYNIGTETITETFGGGNTSCVPVLSNGVNRTNINTELFSVRYRMRSTRPAGCYILNVNGDDGIRVYVDGVLVFSRWVQQGNTSYCNNLINLTGNSEIILDYYENSGGNVLGFSLAPFDGSGNTISGPANVTVCSNTQALLTASNLISCNVNTNTVYQWQSSTNNVTFTDISGVTSRDYTAPAVGVAPGSPNNIRYFRRVFKPSTLTAGTCEFFSNVVTVTTSGSIATTPGSISGSSNQCRSSSGTFSIAPVANAVSYTWTTTGSTGWTIPPASNGPSVSIAFNASATAGTLQVSATNGCGTSTNSIFNVLQLNTPPGTPIVGTNTPPTCVVPTGSVALSSLPAGTWTINASPNTPGLTGLTGSIDNTIIGGLAQGTSYTFTVSNTTCTSMPTAAVVVGSVESITSSDGVNWTSAPTISKIGTITAPSVAPVTITSDTELCSCTISPNTNVEVASGVTLKLEDKLTVNGSLTFKNNASLLQINDVANIGVITYQRETVTAVDKFDYTYWSSPVSGQTLYNTSPNTLSDKYFSFDAVSNNWIQEISVTKVMDPGVGYIIRGPQNHYTPNPINPHRANFIGEPNNGPIPVSITATDASYLLGNPYPSALDADLFLQGNDLVIDGTIYFWTHNTDIAPSGSNYIYDSDDYASYNLTGGASTGNGIPAASDVNPVPTIPTGKIASGQGFFATSIAPGTVNFTNTMRLGGNVNSEFFRSNSKSKKNASFEKNRLWLNFSNTEGAFKQTLIGYVTGATNDYERTFDGISFDGNTFVDFYSVLEDKNFVIQGRALPFVQSDEVQLGYKTTIAGKFTITIFQADGFLTTQNVFLEDKMLGLIHNLKEASYNFTTEKGVFNDRFVLRYTDKTLGTGGFESEDKTIVAFKEKNELKIKSEFETMKRVTIFDLLGKKVFEETLKDVNEFRTSKIALKNQIVIVKVVLTNGQVVTKKISY